MFKLVPTIHSLDGHYLMFINKQTNKKKTDVRCSEVSITLYDQVHLPVSRQGYCDLKRMEKKFQAGSLPWTYVTRLSTVEVVVSGAGLL